MNTGDWTVLDIDGVAETARSAASKVARQYANTTEYEDLHQEALILLAAKPATVRSYVNDPHKGLRLLRHRLCCDLVDQVKTEAKHRASHTSYELARDGAE